LQKRESAYMDKQTCGKIIKGLALLQSKNRAMREKCYAQRFHPMGISNAVNTVCKLAQEIWKACCVNRIFNKHNLIQNSDEIALKYSIHRCFDIQRLPSDSIDYFTQGGKYTRSSFGNDTQTSSLAALASLKATEEVARILQYNIERFSLPVFSNRKQVKREVICIIAKRLCTAIEEFIDNTYRALYDLGFSNAASGVGMSSHFPAHLIFEVEFLFYGRLPDFKNSDNSGYAPWEQNAIHPLRSYLEEIVFLGIHPLEDKVPQGIRTSLDKAFPRKSNRPMERLKIFLRKKLIPPKIYNAIKIIYEEASSTVHTSRTRTLTDIWVMRTCINMLFEEFKKVDWSAFQSH